MDIPAEPLKTWQDGNWEEKRYQYSLYHDDLLIDLGAYQGEWAEKMADIYDVRVIAVEPTPAILRMQGHPRITVINKAAYLSDGVRNFGGSAYWTSAHQEGSLQYPTFDILKLTAQRIAVLKVNVEGDEYGILNRIMANGHATNIEHIQVQFHQIANYQELYEKTVKELSKTHTKTWGVDWVWESWELK